MKKKPSSPHLVIEQPISVLNWSLKADFPGLSFGPYVEVLNVDKRIADILRQAARDHPLLQQVYARVPKGRGLRGLMDHLREA